MMKNETNSPFDNSGTHWFYDLKHNAVVENRIDGTSIIHISPAGGKICFDWKSILDSKSRGRSK
ncbi:hypothetical protein KG383_004851 [Salmonella enterica subsp. enterica serovar Newport]|nr:hypothetical protein [Salmonella enterica subsp. enterica serovar Newport]